MVNGHCEDLSNPVGAHYAGCGLNDQPFSSKPVPGFANKRHPFGAIIVLIITLVSPGGIWGRVVV